MKLDSRGPFQQKPKSIFPSSYAVALLVAKNKIPHIVGETLMKPCILESARIVLLKDGVNISKIRLWSRKTIAGNICTFHQLRDVLCDKPFSAELQKT